MNKKTYKNFYMTLKKSLEKSEDPISEIEKFYNVNVIIDENLEDRQIQSHDYEYYLSMMEKNHVEIKYGKDLGVDELE